MHAADEGMMMLAVLLVDELDLWKMGGRGAVGRGDRVLQEAGFEWGSKEMLNIVFVCHSRGCLRVGTQREAEEAVCLSLVGLKKRKDRIREGDGSIYPIGGHAICCQATVTERILGMPILCLTTFLHLSFLDWLFIYREDIFGTSLPGL